MGMGMCLGYRLAWNIQVFPSSTRLTTTCVYADNLRARESGTAAARAGGRPLQQRGATAAATAAPRPERERSAAEPRRAMRRGHSHAADRG